MNTMNDWYVIHDELYNLIQRLIDVLCMMNCITGYDELVEQAWVLHVWWQHDDYVHARAEPDVFCDDYRSAQLG